MYKSANQLDQRMQEDFTFFFESDRCQLFQELVKEHRTKLHRFITRYIGAREDAAELTQQAFILAYEAYPTFRGQSTFSTWLHGIAMNLVRNYLSRTPSRRYEFVDDHALADLALEGPCPEESASLAQKMRLLSQAMQSLPPHMQEVLMLVAMEEMSYEEAAELLCIPVGTVRSRLSRARTMLKEKIGMEILNAQDTHEHTMLNH